MSREHPGQLELRRLLLGELAGTEAKRLQDHASDCGRCRGALVALREEQRRFEEAVPLERFQAGVERAMRAPPRAERPWRLPALGAAAAVVLAVVMGGPLRATVEPGGGNRLKGGAGMELRIADADGGQRVAAADTPEPLQPGDRVRIGYQGGGRRYVTILSVDEHGEVTPVHPPEGESLPVGTGEQMHYLPDGFEFTGSGAERVIVVLSDEPLRVEALRDAARAAFERAGRDVRRMPLLEVPGEQFSRVVGKP